MNGAELAARYAFPPNSREYCGPRSFGRALLAQLSGKARQRALEHELRKFPVHCAYLSLIARESRKKPFDLAVVRAFWTGNRLLERVRPASMRALVRRLLAKSPTRAARLAKSLPPGILPHHSFNSLFVNFVTDRVARTVRNYDSCCVTFGTVLSVSGRSASVLRHSIVRGRGGLALRKRRCAVALERGGVRFVRRLKRGDRVSVHWGMAIERLSPQHCAALKRYTQENIRAMNRAGGL